MTLLHQLLSTLTAKTSRSRVIFWFSLSLTYSVLYTIPVLQRAFGEPYVVQDDARQHVFWMRRFLDPQLFPNDLIADYFQSAVPWGYTSLYQVFATVGLDPILLSKLLPIVLGLLTTAYGFAVCLELLPVPFAGFVTSVLLNQMIWSHDDVSSATPRAFLPPLFLAFLYYLLRRSLFPCLGAIALQGLFYPQYVLVEAGILCMQPLQWQDGRFTISRNKQDYWFWGILLALAIVILIPYALASSEFGPVVTLEEARHLPEFQPGGRSQFFSDDPWYFWIEGGRTGLFPAFRPALMAIGAILPLLLAFPRWFPLAQHVSRKTMLLLHTTLTSLFLFFAAHALLFTLYLPSRYTTYSLRFVLIFAGAIALTLLLSGLRQGMERSPWPPLSRQLAGWGGTLVIGAALLLFPVYGEDTLKVNYVKGHATELYDFLAQQPKDILIATLTEEGDDLPTFAQRSVLVAREYAIPYHVGYANPFRQRVKDLIQAQYSPNPADVKALIQTYGIDFWVFRPDSFDPETMRQSWLRQYPDELKRALRHTRRDTPFLSLPRLKNRCSVLQTEEVWMLDASCIVRIANRQDVAG